MMFLSFPMAYQYGQVACFTYSVVKDLRSILLFQSSSMTSLAQYCFPRLCMAPIRLYVSILNCVFAPIPMFQSSVLSSLIQNVSIFWNVFARSSCFICALCLRSSLLFLSCQLSSFYPLVSVRKIVFALISCFFHATWLRSHHMFLSSMLSSLSQLVSIVHIVFVCSTCFHPVICLQSKGMFQSFIVFTSRRTNTAAPLPSTRCMAAQCSEYGSPAPCSAPKTQTAQVEPPRNSPGRRHRESGSKTF